MIKSDKQLFLALDSGDLPCALIGVVLKGQLSLSQNGWMPWAENGSSGFKGLSAQRRRSHVQHDQQCSGWIDLACASDSCETGSVLPIPFYLEIEENEEDKGGHSGM